MEGVLEDHENLKDFLEEAELQQYYELFRDILKVAKVSQLKFVVTEDLIQIGLSKPEQRRYKKVYSKYFPNPYISKIKKLLGSNKKNDAYLQGHCSMPLDFEPFSENNIKVPTKHIISVEDITINKELGMGQFGVVQQGTWATGNQRLQVAIKCLGHERMTSNSTEFLKEAAVMHSIEHPNIVRLYGVVLHLDSLMLVTELAPLRSMLECLREVSLRPNFPVPNLCEFGEQICDGMTYLENKRLIHRDLAARNILVFNKDRVKISDFGLSRALGVGKDYYQTNYNVNLKLPVAWCAPECILYLRFTSASDVWAFGVCLWEMFTYGFQPWAAFSGQQILEAIDAPNFQRLEKPECCPEIYYSAMLECWAHDPNDRPKFKDLGPKLKLIRPEQVETTVNFQKSEDGRRSNLLEYKSGQIITVLGKENVTKTSMWHGVLPGGACGMFNPNNTKPYLKTEPPRQVVTPYKPSEDLEQVPLLNPNSPSHLSAACTSPYPLLASDRLANCDEVDLPCEAKARNVKNNNIKSRSEPTTSRSILNKVKSATVGRSHKNDDGGPTIPTKVDEVHEYHEITDTDTEGVARAENLVPLESPGIPKSYGDFSQSLLDEMESMFRSLDGRGRAQESASSTKNFDFDTALRSHTFKPEKKKSFHTGTMKPMSAHDEKTLETAVALANEITTKSMNDLDTDKVPRSPSSKFHFKFPLVSRHHTLPHENDKDINGKHERRNFSEEAHSVPDFQSTLSEASRLAYTSLIEQPTPASLIPHLAPESSHAPHAPRTPQVPHRPATIPKPARASDRSDFHSLQLPYNRQSSNIFNDHETTTDDSNQNELPLPPRATKPKLIDKPRHIRKYPLKLPTSYDTANKVANNGADVQKPVNIYQNAVPSSMIKEYINKKPDNQRMLIAGDEGRDVFDGFEKPKIDMNPFTSSAGPSSANPFSCYLTPLDDEALAQESEGHRQGEQYFEEGSLVNDHVSVEDLLEFADQKPCGRQRGVESDEVRIMNKVLKQQVTPEECLESLELSDWNVHRAIKLVRVKIAVDGAATLEECSQELAKANGDIIKASAILVLSKKE
ncbi:activated Cdc42 kinase-like isoform X2 [Choristoneura fumiferana]|uniref:activated Cdc42 kinase-like isoform X2 n=1 Tax=Choristoneura fumiferana TaxID=7141 RepID=UPI003D15D7C9